MDASRAPTTAHRVLQVHLRRRQPYNKHSLSKTPQDLAAPRPPSTIVAPRQEANFSSTTVSATLRRKSATRRSRLSNSTRRARDLLIDIAQPAVSAATLRVSSFLWPLESTASCYICCHHWTTLAPTTSTSLATDHLQGFYGSSRVVTIKQLFLVPRNAQLSKPTPDILPWAVALPSANTFAHFPTSAPPRISVRAIHFPTSATETSRGCWLRYSCPKAPRREISSAKRQLPLWAPRKPHFRSSRHLLSGIPPEGRVNLLLIKPRFTVDGSANHNSTSEIHLFTAYTLTAHCWISTEIFHLTTHTFQALKPPTHNRWRKISTLHHPHPTRHPPTPRHQK